MSLFRAKVEEEQVNSAGTMSKAGDADSNTAQSILRKTGAALIKGLNSNRKTSGFNVSDQANSSMEMNNAANSSRL